MYTLYRYKKGNGDWGTALISDEALEEAKAEPEFEEIGLDLWFFGDGASDVAAVGKVHIVSEQPQVTMLLASKYIAD